MLFVPFLALLRAGLFFICCLVLESWQVIRVGVIRLQLAAALPEPKLDVNRLV